MYKKVYIKTTWVMIIVYLKSADDVRDNVNFIIIHT